MPKEQHTNKGRIRTHERETDSKSKILGQDVVLDAEHIISMKDTEKEEVSDSLWRNYWNQLGHIMDFWKQEYPKYYAVGVRKLTKKEMKDDDMFWHNSKEDMVYSGMNVKFVKAFLANKKIKLNGQFSSLINIMWGAKEVKETPNTFLL